MKKRTDGDGTVGMGMEMGMGMAMAMAMAIAMAMAMGFEISRQDDVMIRLVHETSADTNSVERCDYIPPDAR